MTPRDALAMVLSTLEAERREADACYTHEAAATDAALAALEAALPDDAPAAPDDAERALARFGAYVVRDWFRRTSGFQAADGFQLDEGALGTGVVTRGATVGYRQAPGIRDAVDRLLAPEAVPS